MRRILVAVALVALALAPGTFSPAAAVPAGANGRIAFNFNDSGGMIVSGPDGANPLTITEDGIHPSWSPDGSKIAFKRNLGTGGGSLLNYEIFTMNADGSNAVRLTNNPAEDGEPAWSPDGTKIAFSSTRSGRSEVWVMNANGTSPVQLTSNEPGFHAFGPAWSPDGTKIAYVNREEGDPDEIYVMNADGSNPTELTDNSADDQSPSWSPDGAAIAFFTNRTGDGEVFAMNADGTNPVNLTDNPGNDSDPAWSPDGTKIAFASGRDGVEQVFVMNADGSNPVDVTQYDGLADEPDWGVPGPPAPPIKFGPWASVSANGHHSCAIGGASAFSRPLYCWGDNGYGQLGDGTTADRSKPTQTGKSGTWARVSAGGSHTCAISTGKSLYCWGNNGDGQLGEGSDADYRTTPRKIGTAGVWAGVAAGDRHTCAISTGKSLYCWGDNDQSQLGDNTDDDRSTPKKIGTSGVWTNVAAGREHTCAISTGRSLYCWGLNFHGQVGIGSSNVGVFDTPQKVGGTGVWAGIASGASHSCALSTAKSLYCWGHNNSGQIGDGTTGTNRLTPRKVGASGVWASPSAGSSHTCAVTTGKSLYCWGDNEHGSVGDGTVTSRKVPTKIGSTGVWTRVNAGTGHTCALATNKAVYCWGANFEGQVGDGTSGDLKLTPKKVG